MPNLKNQLDESAANNLMLEEMYEALEKNLLQKWYPLTVDRTNGGYLTDITHDFKIAPVQHKMIVTQARHVWTTSKAAYMLGRKAYNSASQHGFDFLRNSMWDKKYGGFFQMRDGKGIGFHDALIFARTGKGAPSGDEPRPRACA